MKPMKGIKRLDRFFKEARQPRNILWSHKLDGVRTIATVHPNRMVFYRSYGGKPFQNFGKFDAVLWQAARKIAKVHDWPVQFDGEVMPIGGNGNSLSEVMTQLRRIKNVDDSILCFRVFDVILPKVTQVERYAMVRESIGPSGDGDVSYVKHFHQPERTMDEESVLALMNDAVAEGYEGVMLKVADAYYGDGRSPCWCKVKPHDTEDMKVIGWDPGVGKFDGMLGALVCETEDGKEVSVGTGFSNEDRRSIARRLPDGGWFVDLPDMIEVKFQEATKKGSRRFPAFIQIRNDK